MEYILILTMLHFNGSGYMPVSGDRHQLEGNKTFIDNHECQTHLVGNYLEILKIPRAHDVDGFAISCITKGLKTLNLKESK